MFKIYFHYYYYHWKRSFKMYSIAQLRSWLNMGPLDTEDLESNPVSMTQELCDLRQLQKLCVPV